MVTGYRLSKAIHEKDITRWQLGWEEDGHTAGKGMPKGGFAAG